MTPSSSLSQSDSAQSGAWLVATGGLLLGTIGIFLQQAGQHPLTAVLFRCVFGTVALLAFAAAFGRLAELRASRHALAIAAITGLLMTVMWAAFFAAIQWTSIALATVVFHLQPIWVLLAGVLLWGERLTLGRGLAVAAALVGLTMATGLTTGLTTGLANHQANQQANPNQAVGGEYFLLGIACAALGSVCYAAVSLIAKQQRSLTSLGLTFWQCLVGSLLLAWWPWFHDLPAQALQWHWAVWAWLAGLGVFHTGLAYALMYAGMQRLEAGRIAVLQFVYPITAIVLDWAVYGRSLNATQWAGVVLMGTALWFAGRTPAKRGHF